MKTSSTDTLTSLDHDSDWNYVRISVEDLEQRKRMEKIQMQKMMEYHEIQKDVEMGEVFLGMRQLLHEEG